jgi:hypothetical protein
MIRRDFLPMPLSPAWLTERAVSTCKAVGSKHLPAYGLVRRPPLGRVQALRDVGKSHGKQQPLTTALPHSCAYRPQCPEA